MSSCIKIKDKSKVNFEGKEGSRQEKYNGFVILSIIVLKLETSSFLSPLSTGKSNCIALGFTLHFLLYLQISRRYTPFFPCPSLRLRQLTWNCCASEFVMREDEKACVFDMGEQSGKLFNLAKSMILPSFSWPELLPDRGSRWQQSNAKCTFLLCSQFTWAKMCLMTLQACQTGR